MISGLVIGLLAVAVVACIALEVYAQRIKRALCRRLGHEAILEDRGEPVLRFWICERCGKIIAP